jgi:hypothetical protein
MIAELLVQKTYYSTLYDAFSVFAWDGNEWKGTADIDIGDTGCATVLTFFQILEVQTGAQTTTPSLSSI